MCDICHQNPCHPSCPNASEPDIRGYCGKCGDELREDYEYYTDSDDNEFCSYDCAVEYHDIKPKKWIIKGSDNYKRK